MTGLQPVPQPGAREGISAGLYLDGPDGRECRAQISGDARASRRSSRSRSHQKAAAAQRRRQAQGRDRADQDRATAVGRAGRLHPPRHDAGGAGGAEAGLRRRRHGDRRHLVAADRRRRRRCWSAPRTTRKRNKLDVARAGQERSRSPAARRRSWASARSPATQKALKRAGVDDRRTSTSSSSTRRSPPGARLRARARHLDETKVNLDGGAIALGHPLGATGARITGKAASLLKREGGRYALATQCIGGGQGIATMLERA